MNRIALLLAAASIGVTQRPSFAQKPLLEGNPASPVRVIVFEDLQCPDCANFRTAMEKELLPRFAKSVAFEHRDFPLAKHAWARRAAIAARFFASVSAETGLEFRRETMARLREIKPETFEQHVAAFAKAHGVDPAKAVAALEDPALAAAVESDYQDGVARGVAHTPTVLVDGEPFVERFPIEDVIKSIERALKK
jgi:protein-disulfide isomerase